MHLEESRQLHPLKIRCATKRDLERLEHLSDVVQKLHASSRPDVFRIPVDTKGRLAFLTHALSDPAWRIWLAEYDQRVVAYAMSELMQKHGPIRKPHTEGHLHQICVENAYRQQGVGRSLVIHTIQDLKARNADRITAAFWNFNDASRALFKAAGFSSAMTTVEWSKQ